MILKKEFEATVSRLGLDSEVDQTLAEIIWERCEAAHTHRSSQTATLLKPTKKLAKSFQRDTEALTQSELQFLTKFIADVQNKVYLIFPELKYQIQEAWMLCDPDDESTKENFKILNELKTFRNAVKEQNNKISNVQRKLKKMR